MRVVYIFTDLPAQSGTFANAEILELKRRGLDLEVLCLRSRLSKDGDTESLRGVFRVHRSPYLSLPVLGAALRALIRRPGVCVRSLGRIVADTWTHPRILVKSLGIFPKCCLFASRLSRDRPDWIQAYWASLPGRAAWLLARLTGIPYGTWAHAGADIYNRKHQTEPALRTILADAGLILTCNQTNVGYFERILPRATMRRVVYHPHGIDLGRFRMESSDTPDGHRPVGPTDGHPPARPLGGHSSAQPLDRHPPARGTDGHSSARETDGRRPVRLLSVGALGEAKGVAHAIRACRLLQDRGLDVEYRVIGEGGLRPALERLIDELSLGERIVLAGARPQEELPGEYRRADIFLVPSVIGARGARDGLPNVLLEAMACGLVAVGSDVAGIPEAIEDGVTGILVPPGDPAALAEAVARLAGDPEPARRMAREAHQRVVARYSRQSCMDRLVQIYTSVWGSAEPAIRRQHPAPPPLGAPPTARA